MSLSTYARITSLSHFSTRVQVDDGYDIAFIVVFGKEHSRVDILEPVNFIEFALDDRGDIGVLLANPNGRDIDFDCELRSLLISENISPQLLHIAGIGKSWAHVDIDSKCEL